jgi:hypothetical protein
MSIDVVGAPTVGSAPVAAPSGSLLGSVSWKAIAGIGIVAFQLLLLLLVVGNYKLMPAATGGVLKLIAVGFVAHALAPARYRLALFVGLSVAVAVYVLGWTGGLTLVGTGVVLIGLTRLPVAWWIRISLLVAAGLLLSFGRAGLVPMPIGQAVWPILGSLFMFRMIVYVYDVRHDAKLATWSGAFAYFFMLPNPVFPFFPVVDYKTFRRTYYDADAFRIYQTGVAWMVRGLVHLLLYRFVYYYLTIAPEDVQTSSDLTRYVVANYGLYLRVSGTFHLIVGALHLFGFNLPVTNNAYFLASSFTDYWRRVNIYWKDFMMKVFYYPSYFVLRRTGPIMALVLATVVVFIATTVLHSYQWFWLRGDWYMSDMDVVFWTVLGVAVIVNVVWEAKRGRKRTLGGKQWSLKEELARVGRTLLTFAIISSLWSLWSAPSLREWFGMWSVWNVGSPVSAKAGLLIAAALGAYLLYSWVIANTPSGRWFADYAKRSHLRESPYVAISTLALILVVGNPSVRNNVDSTALLVVEDLQHDRLSRRDQETLERGYYENLFGVENTNPELAARYSRETASWVSLWMTPAVRETGDLRRIEMVPNVDMLYKGVSFTTNEFGMRDRARTLAPVPGVYRFAILGASTTMGSGVTDTEHYPYLIEERIPELMTGTRAEIVNFAVESYNAVEQVATVDQRVFRFSPNAIIYIAHETEFEKTINSLANMVESRTDMSAYPELAGIVARAGLEPGMPRTMALRNLGAQREAIIAWAYRHIAERSRAQGVLPVWVFVPMPVPGTGPCPPGSAQLFCFGNVARAGAAADAADPRVKRLFEIAGEAGFVTLDLSNVYGDADLASLWIAATDGHPNAAGHRLIADGLAAALTSNATITEDMTRITTRSND